MFLAYKLIKPFFLPPGVFLALMFAGLVFLAAKRHKTGRLILTVTFIGFALISTDVVSTLLAGSLVSDDYGNKSADGLYGAEAIVILHGGMWEKDGARPFDELNGQSLHRLLRGIDIYHELSGSVPVIYVGGTGNPFKPVSTAGIVAKEMAVRLGVNERMFYTERESRNTYENGVNALKMLDGLFPGEMHHVILVTSVLHMKRSKLIFEKLGAVVTPCAADYETGGLKLNITSFLPSMGAFMTSYSAIHEWLGIIAYRLCGAL